MCAYLHPNNIRMADAPDFGRRPKFLKDFKHSDDVRFALGLCPGAGLSYTPDMLRRKNLIESLTSKWGPVLEIWEGYAADPEIRFKGSSGGAMNAISLYCLEHEGMHGVLQTKANEKKPYLNKTILSRSRDDLLAAAGSRYSPASPCEKLQEIQTAPSPCVFIGKPCDVAAVQLSMQYKNELKAKVGLTVACFCAGTPSTNGTLEMLRQMGITTPNDLVSLRYRGFGWPGKTVAEKRTDNAKEYSEITYERSWGDILQKYRQWRCYICPDHTGEFADISAGDPWYREINEGEHGHSLILARSENGKKIINSAIAKSYLIAEKADPLILPASQKGFPKARAMLWGRLKTLQFCGVPYPSYSNFSLMELWQNELSGKEKVKVILGTIRRIYKKKLKRKQDIYFGRP